jgi:hypothetical protein
MRLDTERASERTSETVQEAGSAEGDVESDVSRRGLLKWAGVAALGAAGASALGADRADAADGLPVLIGQANSGSSTTSLSLSPPSASPTLDIGGLLSAKELRTKGPDPWADVTAYGATGDGTTPDAWAIQAAINAIKAAGGGVVWFPKPPNGYRVESTIIVDSSDVRLVGAGMNATRLFIATSGDGVLFKNCNRPTMEHMACWVAGPAGSWSPTSLIHLLCEEGSNINQGTLSHVRAFGRGQNAQRGIWIEYSGTTSGGIYDCQFDFVTVDECSIGWQIECSAVGSFTQRNAQHHWVGGITDLCGTGWKIRNCGFFNFFGHDSASHTTDWDIAGGQVLTWDGCYLGGSTTTWLFGGVGSGQTVNLIFTGGSCAHESVFLSAGGAIHSGTHSNVSLLQGSYGRLGRNTLGVASSGRLISIGTQNAAYDFEETAVTNDATAGIVGNWSPDAGPIAIPAGGAATYQAVYVISGQAAGGGNCAGYTLAGTFKAVNTGGAITVTQVGSTNVLSSNESDATWSVSLGVNPSSTSVRANVNGKAGDGEIKWSALVRITEAIHA